MSDASSLKVASVILDDALDRELDYLIPEQMASDVRPGARVVVPVKNTLRPGTVWAVKDSSAHVRLKAIKELVSQDSVLTKDLLSLAKWMSAYYCTPLYKVLITMLPSSVRKDTEEKAVYIVKKLRSQQAMAELCSEMRGKDPKQAKVLEVMLQSPQRITLSELLSLAQVSKSPVETLAKKKIIALEKQALSSQGLIDEEYFPTKPKKLTDEQALALQSIQKDLKEETFSSHLLFGVTGSGKTEVYLQAIDYALSLKKGVIFLIPEIILTSQTIERLKGRFKEKIALLHHRLSHGERSQTWKSILSGQSPIVVGARSALFSPVANLGLIIVDEEHESSYKQSEESPCYHARDVAIVRAKLCGAVALLGSATPSLESYANALKGKYKLLPLTSRPAHFSLPQVHIVDMKHEFDKKKGFTLFSDALLSAIKQRLSLGEQSLLLLNRRGYHSSQMCLKCAHVICCPHCDMNLTYHLSEDILACHLCDYRIKTPRSCPSCNKEGELKFRGAGTEMVEKALYALFPEARIVRMDADTTRKKGSHEELCKKFKSGKADILIGTQMIAKGLHFPLVTLVGVLNADTTLQIPDFRSSESLFQLITQVAGRSGRGDLKGEVILQTMLPDHITLKQAAEQNYLSFYKEEIEIRKMFHFPPFVHLVKWTFSGHDEKQVQDSAEDIRRRLITLLPKEVEILPLAPCGHAKIQDNFRFQFLLKMDRVLQLEKITKDIQGMLKKNKIRLFVDVDPLSTFF